MKRIHKNKRHSGSVCRKYLYALMAGAALTSFSSCGNSGKAEEKHSRIDEIINSDSIPDDVKQFVKSVDSDDSVSFSKLVSYPVSRPYPLHDIENEKEMRKYYNHIVDDSLKKVIRESGPEDWFEAGWRGWSVKDGNYVWIDGQVYDINYVSKQEQRDIDSLSKVEIATLHPTLRGDWTPVGCLISRDHKNIYRIDAHRRAGKKKRSEQDSLRLSIYDRKIHPEVMPRRVLTGHEETEGSAAIVIYYFSDGDGTSVSYNANGANDEGPAIYYTDKDGNETRVDVSPGYWLDIMAGETNNISAQSDSTTNSTPVTPSKELPPDTIGK